MMLVRQELYAVLIMLIVLLTLGIASYVLDGSHSAFAIPYEETLSDGTLVSHTGVIESITATKNGNHHILNVSGVVVFIPATIETTLLSKGDTIELTGEMATFQGKREIMLTDTDIITVVS